MDRKLLAVVLFAVAFVFPAAANAWDKSTVADDDLRTEMRELKRLVLGLSDRLDVLEKRLSQVEQERRSSRQAGEFQRPGRRPLGSYSVDKHGIIWDGEFPVGIWGVWGDQEPDPGIRVYR
jgi:hypothetical protein